MEWSLFHAGRPLFFPSHVIISCSFATAFSSNAMRVLRILKVYAGKSCVVARSLLCKKTVVPSSEEITMVPSTLFLRKRSARSLSSANELVVQKTVSISTNKKYGAERSIGILPYTKSGKTMCLTACSGGV